jgi:hypothetical protein
MTIARNSILQHIVSGLSAGLSQNNFSPLDFGRNALFCCKLHVLILLRFVMFNPIKNEAKWKEEYH